MTVLQVRKKPVEVQAMLYDGSNAEEVCKWVNDNFVSVVQAHRLYRQDTLIIPTLESPHEASLGDYIIRGVKGEFYPCKPEIFAMTYEIVVNLVKE